MDFLCVDFVNGIWDLILCCVRWYLLDDEIYFGRDGSLFFVRVMREG